MRHVDTGRLVLLGSGPMEPELRRMVAHLGTAFETARHDAESPQAMETLLRAASDRYLESHRKKLPARTRRKLKPVSATAIKALAAVLVGPKAAVYAVASTSDASVAYRIEVDGADITCDCRGFSYRGMCKHSRELKDAIATGASIPSHFVRVE